MQRISVNTLGFDLTREVPATIDEYNGLAPKRTNPVLEDAVNNILYRDTFADFRDKFITKLVEVTGFARANHGTEEEPQWETEAKYLKRLIAAKVAEGKTEAALRSEWQSLAQSCMDSSSFNVAERESKGTGVAYGKRDLELAEKVVTDGKADAVASKLAQILGREIPSDAKSIARALADKRRAENAAAEAKLKAELGV
jgi:hypothetical protein